MQGIFIVVDISNPASDKKSTKRATNTDCAKNNSTQAIAKFAQDIANDNLPVSTSERLMDPTFTGMDGSLCRIDLKVQPDPASRMLSCLLAAQ